MCCWRHMLPPGPGTADSEALPNMRSHKEQRSNIYAELMRPTVKFRSAIKIRAERHLLQGWHHAREIFSSDKYRGRQSLPGWTWWLLETYILAVSVSEAKLQTLLGVIPINTNWKSVLRNTNQPVRADLSENALVKQTLLFWLLRCFNNCINICLNGILRKADLTRLPNPD